MAKDSGKSWEDNFKEQCEEQNIEITRLHDVFQGQKSITNHCDFIVYQYPYTFHCELKSTGTGTLPLTNLSRNQFDGLMKRKDIMGVVCGLIIQYRKYQKIYFIPIDEVRRFKESGIKSIKHKDIERGDIISIELPSKIKKVNYVLSLQPFLKEVGDSLWDKTISSYNHKKLIK